MAKREQKSSVSNLKPRFKQLTRKQKKVKAKKEARKRNPLEGSFRLSWYSLKIIKKHWRPLGGIMLVYLILNIILASGISNLSTAVSDIKFNLNAAGSENLNPLGTALSGFSDLVASGGTSASPTGSALQTALIIIVSLVIIWALRHLLAGKKIGIKQAYYSSMAPLIPFLLILLVIVVQLLPILLGIPIVSTVLAAIFVDGGTLSAVIFMIAAAGLLGWSLYMISSSVFAVYIVTLPDMHPRQALRSAKNLAAFRRWAIMRRLIFLPIITLIAMAVVVVPLILWATFLVVPVFLALSVFSLLFAHTYLYSLYRELIA